MKKQDGNDGYKSYFFIFTSEIKYVVLKDANLEGTPYHIINFIFRNCFDLCVSDLFCDAVTHDLSNRTCSMYSMKDITNIVIQNGSWLEFIGPRNVNLL